MKLKSRIFYKLFGLMIFGFLIVFIIQYLGRVTFFEQVYINNINSRNISNIKIVADRLNHGDVLWEIIDEEGLNDIDVTVRNIHYSEDYSFDRSMNEDGFIEKDGVYYKIYDPVATDSTLIVEYRMLLDDESTLTFTYLMFGLVNAQNALNSIDLYIIIGMIIFLLPYTYWYSKRFSKPLIMLSKQIDALSVLEFPEALKPKTSDEIGQLIRSINKVSHNLEEAINKLRKDIEFEKHRDKKRRELIASLSHELKTPITTLRAVLEGMSDNVGKYRNHEEYLKKSLEYLNYMETMSKDLIDAINIESLPVDKESYSLLNIYNQSLGYTKNGIQAKNQNLVSNITDCKVFCNEDMILRVFINLLNNASKYSKEKEKIIVDSTILGNEVQISVLNTGSHIDPKDITKVFEPYYRVDKARSDKTEGSGLGLYIIKSILDGHDSKYNIQNAKDGVRFTFTLLMDKGGRGSL